MTSISSSAHIKVFALAVLFTAFYSSSPAQTDFGWKTYKNNNYQFTFEYPAKGWTLYEGEDRNGVAIYASDSGEFHQRPQLGAGGHIGQSSHVDEKRPQTLEEDFQSQLKTMSDYGHAKELQVLSRKSRELQGLKGIESTVQYKDPPTGDIWIYRSVLLHTSNNRLTYDLMLTCSPKDMHTLMPLFEKMIRTFRILGPPY